MDASQINSAQCLGPWTQPTGAKAQGSPVHVFGRTVNRLTDIKPQVREVQSQRTEKPEAFVQALQKMKVEVCKHYSGCDAATGSNISNLFANLEDLRPVSLLDLSAKEMDQLQKEVLIAEGLNSEEGGKPNKSKSSKMTTEKLETVFDALTTNPFTPSVMKRLAIKQPEMFVKLLHQANTSALTAREYEAIYQGCQAYMNEGEGREMIMLTPQAVDYVLFHKRVLPPIPERCFRSEDGTMNQMIFLMSALQTGGADSVSAELPKDFKFEAGEKYVAFDASNMDHRFMKVLDTSVAQCYGALAVMRKHTADMEESVDSKLIPQLASQTTLVGQMNAQLQDLSGLLGQSYMTQNLPEYARDLNHYQRVIYVSPNSTCLKTSEPPKPSEIVLNFDTYHPRVPEYEGGPWKTSQPKYKDARNWPSVDFTEGFCWDEKALKQEAKANKSTFYSSGSDSEDSGISTR
ncbi:hypothetical protein [Endozoicomonas arenosclerae]|uniref:hypothetical protein n=1 Tax=Endozoicomonas arenosclerae TaxID=1633495 RepID=UPI0012947202|nr:hypothetical protein [Endozoicomonas arenosclerae]